MPMYNLIGCSDNYLNKSGLLWQYFRDEPAINDGNGNIVDFNTDSATTDSFEIKENITGKIDNTSTKNVEIMLPLIYLSNFWRTLQILFINCGINLDLNWSEKSVIAAAAVKAAGEI